MLLTFPIPKAHQQADHLRTPELRRAIESHVFCDQTKSDVADRIQAQQRELSPLPLLVVRKRIAAQRTLDDVPPTPIARLLLRLRSSRAGNQAQDPLI